MQTHEERHLFGRDRRGDESRPFSYSIWAIADRPPTRPADPTRRTLDPTSRRTWSLQCNYQVRVPFCWSVHQNLTHFFRQRLLPSLVPVCPACEHAYPVDCSTSCGPVLSFT